MRWRKIKSHRGRRLSKEQIAIAAVLAQAISNYSEDTFFAGWLCDIEHELWERIEVCKPDAYERSVKKLYAAGKQKRTDWGKPSAEFLAGLKLLAERFQVWVVYQKSETAIHLNDWRPLHEKWFERQKQHRPELEKVWERIHQPFPRVASEKAVKIPPMPKL